MRKYPIIIIRPPLRFLTILSIIPGLFEANHMQYEDDRLEDVAGEPPIADMVEKAIKVMERNDKGFFLLVEGQ